MHWTRLTALRELHLQCEDHGPVPAGLGGMTGLLQLSILDANLDDLPAVPYLSRLQSLRMASCTFQSGVPAQLAAATQLHNLHVSKSLGISLTAAYVTLLSSLPALENLKLEKARLGRKVWAHGVARLRAAFSDRGGAPPTITG